MKSSVWVLLGVLCTIGCRDEVRQPAPRSHVRLTTGTPGGGFQPLGDALARALREALPDVDLELRQSAGSISNVEAIQTGTADIGFAFADVAYTAFAGGLAGGVRFERLRGIAVLHLTPLHLVASGRSGIRSIADLRGRRVAVGRPGSGSALTADLVMKAFAIDASALQLQSLAYNEAAARLAAGSLDAFFVVGSVPLESVKVVIGAGARLVPLEGQEIERLRHRYPFLRRAVIPGGAYPEHPGQVTTIGVDNILVCSSQLSESLVYAITRRLFEALPLLASQHPSLRLMDLDQSPATPIPLHDGAARFYREREIAR